MSRKFNTTVISILLAIMGLACGGVEPAKVDKQRAPTASVVAGAGVVRGGNVTMVVQVGQPFAQAKTKADSATVEPLAPVTQ